MYVDSADYLESMESEAFSVLATAGFAVSAAGFSSVLASAFFGAAFSVLAAAGFAVSAAGFSSL